MLFLLVPHIFGGLFAVKQPRITMMTQGTIMGGQNSLRLAISCPFQSYNGGKSQILRFTLRSRLVS